MESLFQDLRYGARMLARKPGFTFVAAVTLALGIGANTALFSVVDAVLLRPLPFADPARLVLIRENHPEVPNVGVATPDYHDWLEQSRSFQEMAAYSFKGYGALVLTGGEPEQLQGTLISQNLLPMLGVVEIKGRNFLPEEAQTGRDNVAIISYALWQRRFDGDPDLIGKSIRLNGESFTVVGILEQQKQFPITTDIWLPLSRLSAQDQQSRTYHALEVVARLNNGTGIEQARAEMESIAGRLAERYPATNKNIGITLVSLQDFLSGSLRPALLILLAAVSLVLLIASVNVANLLLARAQARQQEVAVRAALGAGYWRILRQFLTESLLLALLGSALGVLLAAWGVPLLKTALASVTAEPIPGLAQAAIDLRVLGFTLCVGALSGIVAGLVPALQASRINLSETLKQNNRTSAGPARGRVGSALVCAQVAMATVVLVSAGLLVRSFQQLSCADPGFNADHLLTMRVSLPAERYQQNSQVIGFYQQLFQRIEALPGAQAAGAINDFGLAPSRAKTRFAVAGEPPPEPGGYPVAQIRAVSQDYFAAMKIELKSGRVFTEDDIVNQSSRFIVNETLARRYFPNQDPVGKKILMGVMTASPIPIEIIGVIADVKDLGLDAEVEPELYYPGFANQGLLMVRTTADPAGMVDSVRGAMQAIDKELPAPYARSMREMISSSLGRQRIATFLLGSFALLALALAGIGIYGIIAWSVTERAREIGLRLAFGAQTGDVLNMVIRQGMKLTIIGLGVGLIASAALMRLLKSLLYGVSATDPATFAVIALLLAGVALMACFVPARQATKVDPMVALRYE